MAILDWCKGMVGVKPRNAGALDHTFCLKIGREINEARNVARLLSLPFEEFHFKYSKVEIKSSDGDRAIAGYLVHASFRAKSFEYIGGQGLSWLEQFEADLRNGWGGTPLLRGQVQLQIFNVTAGQ